MRIRQFIDKYYPMKEKLEQMRGDPILAVNEKDDLPYDAIMVVEGTLQKVVEVSEDTYVPVTELLSFNRDDVEKLASKEYLETWDAYMDQIDMSDMSIKQIIDAATVYRKERARLKEVM